MAGSVNRVILVGNLGRDPEVRNAQNGAKIVNFTLATSETWNDKQTGERQERTEWHRVVVFNDRIADVAERYLHKGAKVYVEGGLQTRKWTDQSGQERYTTEVVIPRFSGALVMLGGPNEDAGDGGCADTSGQRSAPPRRETAASGGGGGYVPRGGEWDEDIPFRECRD